ncbi:hypothetical protein FB451DRAFT_1168254 [Mycena latifolia]|nr:hypothetical protein FB451DRAFT_1168254 [Mycena latifolia]
MPSYYGPDEPASIIQLERTFLAGTSNPRLPLIRLLRHLVQGDLVAGTGFGVQSALYVSCILYLWKRKKEDRYGCFLLAYITVLFFVEFLFVAVQALTVQMIYIDNRNYPGERLLVALLHTRSFRILNPDLQSAGGPWAFFLATQNAPVNVIFYATFFALTFLSDILVLWRCWVIWAADGRQGIAYLAISFPSIALLASFAMGVLWTLQSSQPGQLPRTYGTAYYAISLSVNIITSFIIITRLLIYRRRLRADIPNTRARHYISVVTIFVESAALYSVFAILFLITYAVNQPTNKIWLGVSSMAQRIAGYLIIYRLADGTAWKSDTMRGSSIVPSEMRLSLGDDALEIRTVARTPPNRTIASEAAEIKVVNGLEDGSRCKIAAI